MGSGLQALPVLALGDDVCPWHAPQGELVRLVRQVAQGQLVSLDRSWNMAYHIIDG